MKTTVKKLSDTKVELTITVDAEELAIAEQVAIVRLAREVKVPGFRKGNAPDSLIAQKVGEMKLLEEAAEIALS